MSGSFSLEFESAPNGNNISALTSLSSGKASSTNNGAVILRFNSAGNIDAVNGGGYSAVQSIPYSAGVTYHFQVYVNVSTHTYTALVTPDGALSQVLAQNYAFSSSQANVSSLNDLGVYASSGSHSVFNAVLNIPLSTGPVPSPAPSPSLAPSPSPAPAPSEAPYSGTAVSLPGTIQAVNFDQGGEGIAYHDTEPTNLGRQYRTSEGVDIKTSTDTTDSTNTTGYVVGWMATGEWLNYTVNVSQTGPYSVKARVESADGGSFHVEFDNVNLTGSISVPNTGPWDTASSWQTLSLPTVNLTAGRHVMKVVVDSQWFDLNTIQFVTGSTPAPTPTPTPSSTPTAGQLPGPAPTFTTIPAGAITISAGSSIQAAINAHPMGTAFYLPPDTWHQQHVVLKSNDVLFGDPNGGTILTGDGVTADFVSDDSDGVSGVTLTNLTLTHYTGSAVHGAITNWTYNNITSTYNSIGLYLSTGAQVHGGHFNNNSRSGLHACCTTGPILVEYAEVGNNNTGHNDPNYDAAGIKMEVDNLTFRYSYIHDNYGQGLWADCDSHNWEVYGNTVINNSGNGIHYEISYGTTKIHDNVIRNNGWSGIYISNSSGVEVYNNTVDVSPSSYGVQTGAFGAINAIYDNRGLQGTGCGGPATSSQPYMTTNNYYHDNTVIFRSTNGILGYFYDYDPSVGSSFINAFTHNTYYVPNLTTQFWRNNGAAYNFSGWQGVGQDTTGSVHIGLPQ